MAYSSKPVDVSGWTNGPDSESHQKRSDIFHELIENHCLDQFRTIVESGWDVNEELHGYYPHQPLLHAIIHSKKYVQLVKTVQLLLEHGANPDVAQKVNIEKYAEAKWAHRTALQEAASRGWTQVVKMLLDAGAKCTMSDSLQNPLALALQNHDCPTDLIDLLLKHGADPNNHDDQHGNIPLLKATENCRHKDYFGSGNYENNTTNVKLLLEHGAKLNVTHTVNIAGHGEATFVQRTALHEALRLGLTDVVKILFDAGAKCTSDCLQNELVLAQKMDSCTPDLIELLLKHGADPNCHMTDREIPLFCAITSYRDTVHLSKIVQLLLEYGANPNVTQRVDIAGLGEEKWVRTTALTEAASRGLTDVVKMLLDSGAKCTMCDALGNPLVLVLRSRGCPPDLIKLLLKHGADPNGHDDQGDNVPLFNAIANTRNYEDATIIVQLLLEHGADPNVSCRVKKGGYKKNEWVELSALHEAARRGFTDVVKMLLDAGAKCTMSLPNLMKLALQNSNCHPDLIGLLLKLGADPNYHEKDEGFPLFCAVTNIKNSLHLSKIVQLLLEHGANPNGTHRVDVGRWGEAKWLESTALHEAVKQGLTEVVKMLLDAGAKCTSSDELQKPLTLAVEKYECQPDLVELLLKHGADPNDHDNQYVNIPLLIVISNPVIVQLLLKHGADPNVSCREKKGGYEKNKWVESTALHEAVRQESTEVVKMLLEAGAKCVTSDTLKNPLALALQNYDCPPDLIELLLKHGADLHYLHQRSTLLHRLTHYTYYDHCMFLRQQLDLVFQHGGNINMEDSDHRTALECVIKGDGHSNSVRWLIRHGADVSLQFTLFKEHFMEYTDICFHETPLILLQAGIIIPNGTQTQLSNLEVAISTWLQDDTVDDENISRAIEGMWKQLEKAKEEESHRVQCNLKKRTFTDYCSRQMVDLQEFSDESLHAYPEDTHISVTQDTRQGYQKPYQSMLDQIHRVQEFLSQPKSLKWHCRCCVRENLVSLQPSVVKTLPVPARLKRYILCHEI